MLYSRMSSHRSWGPRLQLERSSASSPVSPLQHLVCIFHYLDCELVLTLDISGGSITLASADPFVFPVIDAGFLTSPVDMAVMIEAIKISEAMVATQPWRQEGFIQEPFGALANATTDQDLEAIIRDGVVTFWHTSCTARMGTLEDPMAVVDPSLRLKGAKGMRVVDASVFVSLAPILSNYILIAPSAFYPRRSPSGPCLCNR
jgi:choline dehydrogenase-like flavoprotein